MIPGRPARILLVSARAGAGHLRAAEALHRAFAANAPGVRVEHVDVLELAPRWVRTAYADGFEWIAARAPRVWRQIYQRTDGPGPDLQRWGVMAERTLFRAFRRLLQAEPWGMVVCTHFLPPQLAAARPCLPPFATVITDFTLHRYWLQPGVRRYFVATPALAQAVEQQVPGSRVLATGIPVDPAFAATPCRAEARRALGLDPCRPTVLVMGGGLGLGVEEAASAACDAGLDQLQVLAVCGRNTTVCERLRSWDLPPERLRVWGFERGVERFLAAADAVIGKPGGLSSSETLAVGRPLILYRPIPGQEEGNIQVLVGSGSALHAPDPAALRHLLVRLFREPGLLATLTEAARTTGRPHAARDIARAVQQEVTAPRVNRVAGGVRAVVSPGAIGSIPRGGER